MSKSLKTLVAAAALAAAGVASATPIVGIANLTVGQVIITNGNIDWNNDPLNIDPPPNNGNTTNGAFEVINLRTGSFLGVPVGTAGTIRDMANPTILPGETGNAFLGVPTNVSKFLTFAAKPNWIFDATFLVQGIGLSPFFLTQVGDNVSVTMTVRGRACDDTTGVAGVCDAADDITKWTGIFSAQYTDTTIGELTAIILGGGALDNNSWSGTIQASRLPEPASVALVGLALAGVGFASRRRAAK